MPVRGVFFDLDGTLADTMPQLVRASARTCELMGIPVPSYETMRSYVGNGVWMILVRLIAGRYEAKREEVDEALLQRTREVYNRCYFEGLASDFTVYPGVVETLKFCHEKGAKTAVITNKPEMFAKPLLHHMQLDSYFDFILGGEVLKERKPNPEPLLYVAEKFQLEPDSCLMVGDSDNDILAGKNAKMRTIFLKGGYYSKDPKLLEPDYLLSDYQEILATLKTLL
ncbi:MAG: HAD-IA family hydrolase [Succinivibrio sp.]|nr:HAD-IA family hydrolase [Succinivibrio sp.]